MNNNTLILRDFYVKTILHLLTQYPVVALMGARQVKSPKIYLGDSGLLHTLLSLHTEEDVLNHPKVGASWEGFIIQTILNILEIPFYEAFFWKIHQGAELDLFFMRDNQKIGIECKRTSSPVLTKSLNMAIEYLKLTHAFIIHAGDDSFELSHKVTALSAYHLHNIKQFMGS